MANSIPVGVLRRFVLLFLWSSLLHSNPAQAFWGVEQELYLGHYSAYTIVDGGYIDILGGHHFRSRHPEAHFARKMLFFNEPGFKEYTCILLATVLDCRTIQFTVGTFIIDAATISEGVCILNESNVQCFNSKAKTVTLTFTSKGSPKQLVSSGSNLCVLFDPGAKGRIECWNVANLEPIDLPELEEVEKIYANSGLVCAMTGLGLKCWGQWFGKSEIPNLDRSYTEITVSHRNICAIKNRQGQCWGLEANKIPPELLSEIDKLAVGFTRFCALKDQGIYCFEAEKPEAGIEVFARDLAKSDPEEIKSVQGDTRNLFVSSGTSTRESGRWKNHFNLSNISNVRHTMRFHQGSFCTLNHDSGVIACGGDRHIVNHNGKYLTSDGYRYCAILAEDKIHCWQYEFKEIKTISNFTHQPRTIANAKALYLFYNNTLCAKVEKIENKHEMRCFKPDGNPEGEVLSGFDNPTKILANGCVLDTEGVYCPEAKSYKKIVPTLDELPSNVARLDFDSICLFFPVNKAIECFEVSSNQKSKNAWPTDVKYPEAIYELDAYQMCVKSPRGLECSPGISDDCNHVHMGRFDDMLQRLALFANRDRASLLRGFAALQLDTKQKQNFAKLLLHDLVVTSLPRTFKPKLEDQWNKFLELLKLYSQTNQFNDFVLSKDLLDLSVEVVSTIFADWAASKDDGLLVQVERFRFYMSNVGWFQESKKDLGALASLLLKDTQFMRTIIRGDRREESGLIVKRVLEWWRKGSE